MRVWVVSRVWRGGYQSDYVSIDRIFASEKAADEYIKAQKTKPVDSYGKPYYDVEEYEVEGVSQHGPTHL